MEVDEPSQGGGAMSMAAVGGEWRGRRCHRERARVPLELHGYDRDHGTLIRP